MDVSPGQNNSPLRVNGTIEEFREAWKPFSYEPELRGASMGSAVFGGWEISAMHRGWARDEVLKNSRPAIEQEYFASVVDTASIKKSIVTPENIYTASRQTEGLCTHWAPEPVVTEKALLDASSQLSDAAKPLSDLGETIYSFLNYLNVERALKAVGLSVATVKFDQQETFSDLARFIKQQSGLFVDAQDFQMAIFEGLRGSTIKQNDLLQELQGAFDKAATALTKLQTAVTIMEVLHPKALNARETYDQFESLRGVEPMVSSANKTISSTAQALLESTAIPTEFKALGELGKRIAGELSTIESGFKERSIALASSRVDGIIEGLFNSVLDIPSHSGVPTLLKVFTHTALHIATDSSGVGPLRMKIMDDSEFPRELYAMIETLGGTDANEIHQKAMHLPLVINRRGRGGNEPRYGAEKFWFAVFTNALCQHASAFVGDAITKRLPAENKAAA